MRAARLAAVVALVACADATPAAVTVSVAASSSIARTTDGAALWVTSPDDARVHRLDASTLTVTRSVTVDGAPESLALFEGGVLVARARRGALAWIDDAGVRDVPIPCGGARAVVALTATRALAACPFEDRLVVVDVAAQRVVRVVPSTGRPTALAVAGGDVFVSASRLGRVRTWSRDALASDDVLRTPTARAEVSLESRAGFAASQVDALAAVSIGGAALAAWQSVDRDSDRTRPAARGGYGAVFEDRPRIEPRLLAPCGGRYARFDGSAAVTSGPSALAWAAGILWVAHRYTDTVAVIPCPAGASSPSTFASAPAPRLATFRTGRGPRGLVLSADGRRAWVDVGFDHAVALLDLDAPARTEPRDASATQRRALSPDAAPDAVLRGRNLFHDAVDTHLTPSGVVACATCHPEGDDDGLTWFLHTTNVPRKLRRTPPAWGARADLAPFHWDGEFSDAERLTRVAITELMGGDGLLVDTGAMAAYMAWLAPRRAVADDASQIAAGAAVFARADVGCATCHRGDALTDRLAHAVVPDTSDADARMAAVDTPSLRGVFARAPHLHDGRAPTLRAVLTTHNVGDTHGRTSQLSATELDALEAYVRSR